VGVIDQITKTTTFKKLVLAKFWQHLCNAVFGAREPVRKQHSKNKQRRDSLKIIGAQDEM